MRELHIDRPWLQVMTWTGGFWLRVPARGRGIWFSTYRGHPEGFSEREGQSAVHRVGKWARWKWLERREEGTEDLLVAGEELHRQICADLDRRLLFGSAAYRPATDSEGPALMGEIAS